MKWFEQLTDKQKLHWVDNPRSGASWPELWPEMDISKSRLPKKLVKHKRIKRNMARESRRRNRR